MESSSAWLIGSADRLPRSLHLIMTGSLSAVIGVLLFVSIAIDHPFAGDLAVSPAPLERVISDFDNAP